jgi:pyrimidine operon attenuation protein/uracil phosphoribosyltransferase
MVLADRSERELPVSADFASQTVILPESQILVLERNQDNQFSFVIEERNK